MNKPRIVIASDHGAVELKEVLYNYLLEQGFTITDLSPKNDPKDDYPDFAYKVGRAIQEKEADLGILACTSGIGISIAANKMKGIYCGRIVNSKDVIHACNDNGINVISLSGNDITVSDAKKCVDNFLDSEKLNDERHIRRFKKIIEIEEGTYNEL